MRLKTGQCGYVLPPLTSGLHLSQVLEGDGNSPMQIFALNNLMSSHTAVYKIDLLAVVEEIDSSFQP